ncbi:SAM-dependent methyltransferase [Vibrio sp. RE88]|uniref:SAM-dependent methyltransferase n=1 Tax=Vibrio sp. RE88 TaxID=2607610 RepID=UPI00149336BD|nr:SAM-dependent methyltransferase [Vibrio sp. RE88]NOH61558.1 SAM-dependent methyltransferase [Vibrio sp. RE88]
MDDFYLTEKWLASYIEASWIDKCLGAEAKRPKSQNVPTQFIQSNYSIQAAQAVVKQLSKHNITPESLLEVGPACGRANYELVSSCEELKRVYLVEPSRRLLDAFTDILLTPGVSRFRALATEGVDLELDTTSLSNKYLPLVVETFNTPASDELAIPQCELVVCLNVLDQCESPKQVVDYLMSRVSNGGVLVLSCTYQWNDKHLKTPSEGIDDINGYFDQRWQKLDDQEFEYRFRINERYSMLFLSHTVIYQRL